MSSQDQRSELSTPTILGCNHHHSHLQQQQQQQQQSTHTINRLPTSSSVQSSCDHICTCIHHHTQHSHLPSSHQLQQQQQQQHHHQQQHHQQQHYHTHNNTNFSVHNNINNVNFGQQQHHNNNNNNQNHNPSNEVNQTNLELNHQHHPTQNNLAICHHYISVPNVNSNTQNNINISTVPSCECGGGGGSDGGGNVDGSCVDGICVISNNLHQDHSERSSRILSVDEIEDCEKRKYINKTKNGFEETKTGSGVRQQSEEIRKCTNRLMLEDRKFMNRIEVYSDGADSGVKIDDVTSEEDQGPPLPPRPPPRPRNLSLNETE